MLSLYASPLASDEQGYDKLIRKTFSIFSLKVALWR